MCEQPEDFVCEYQGCNSPADWYCPGCYEWYCKDHLITKEVWFQKKTPYEREYEVIQVTACGTCLAYAKKHGIWPSDEFFEFEEDEEEPDKPF